MSDSAGRAGDWAGGPRSYLLVWGLPIAVIVTGAFAGVAVRAALWSAALAWMGIACLLNVRRCGRTHCRYTGPFYLAMIVPVLAPGAGLASVTAYDWWVVGLVILFGGKAIWWVTERAWGRYT